MSRLQVAIIAPTLEILGGHSVQAQRLLDAWHGDPDIEAWLVPINPRPPRPFDSALQVKYARTIVTEATYIPRLVGELRRADIVHVFSASYTSFLLAPLPAIAVARLIGRPVVLNYHSGEAADHLTRSPVARSALSRVDSIVVPSPFLAGVFASFGLRAAVVPNMIDLASFPFRDRDPLRPRFLSTRNLAYPYNVGITLRAFADIHAARPDASLTVVGSGPEEEPLKRLARDLGLRNVQFTGRVEPQAMARLYGEHDIYVQTPDLDNMPLSLIEAFASGLPVVSTRAGGVPMILRNERDGLLVPVGDHHAVAAAALRLLTDPDRARRHARNAYRTCAAYAWPTVREQWLSVYRRAAGRSTARDDIQGLSFDRA
ncbi:MAG TPA: glycosyltransferase family 4 protein [Vicinamibacterales bacterium]|nr:glycosyltransferase family 4 protein [Vicinamibacterales bacterium]